MAERASAAVASEAAHAEPIARRLADFAHTLRYEDIPEAVRERARYLILDAVGIAYASTHYEFSKDILAGLTELAGAGEHPVIGLAARLPLRDSVVMNGALIHGLDYDDTHLEAIVHPTASAFSAALGMAAHLDLSGRDLLTAYVVGMETVIRISLAARGGLHRYGFHPTGIAGHFSTALAAGRLLGLSRPQLAMAQGLAGSTAAASQEFLEEGGWNKRFHPGWAAASGITVAYLAKNGFIGPTYPYEGRFGLYRSHMHDDADTIDYEDATSGLGQVWETTRTAVKPFPTCHFTHSIADSALAIREAHGVAAADIVHIRAQMPEVAVPLIAEPVARKRRPVSDYDAKFSTPFMVAACFVRGKFGLAELEPEALQDPEILALADKVDYELDPKTGFPQYYSGGLIITTRDGAEYVHHERVNRGAGERALTGDEIAAKYLDNATLVMGQGEAQAVRDRVLALDSVGARDFAESLARS